MLMTQLEKDLDWLVQKKMNDWGEKRRYNAALEELMEGKVRYLKFIKLNMEKMGRPNAVDEALEEFVKDTFNKNMSGLTKLGAEVLKMLSKKVLLKKIITSFFINLQHLVNLDRMKKLEFYPDRTEIVIQKCTAKRAWKLGVKNNKVKELFTDLDFCTKFCSKTFNRFLEVAGAQSTVEFQKRGCQHLVKFVK